MLGDISAKAAHLLSLPKVLNYGDKNVMLLTDHLIKCLAFWILICFVTYCLRYLTSSLS